MSDEQEQIQGPHPWEKQEGESALWFRRFERYRLLFPRRSVAAVYHEEHPQNPDKPRQKPGREWYDAAKQWHWEERAEAWDAHEFAKEEKIKLRVMRSGYALQHNRILMLQEQLSTLLAYTQEEHRVWVPDVKGVGTGEFAERVDLAQFNDALFKEIREYLTDIAEEMGERIKKKDVTVTQLPPDRYDGIGPEEDGSVP